MQKAFQSEREESWPQNLGDVVLLDWHTFNIFLKFYWFEVKFAKIAGISKKHQIWINYEEITKQFLEDPPSEILSMLIYTFSVICLKVPLCPYICEIENRYIFINFNLHLRFLYISISCQILVFLMICFFSLSEVSKSLFLSEVSILAYPLLYSAANQCVKCINIWI